MLSLRLGQRGDSIVEVLIAVAIVSLVVTAGYVISNKNTQANQDNQERVEAQHLVESQIEALRAQNGLKTSGDCFAGATETSACGNFSRPGSGASYAVSVNGPVGVITPTDGSARQYTITAKWTSLGAQGGGNSNVTMIYRLN